MKLNLGAYEYTVRFCNEELLGDGDYLGRCNFSRQLIKISNEQTVENIIESLMHECLHIINDHYKIHLKEDEIGRLSEGIMDMLFRNPDYFSVNFKNIKKETNQDAS